MVLKTGTQTSDWRSRTNNAATDLVWGTTVMAVHDDEMASQIKAEAEANPPYSDCVIPRKWDHPFTALKHLDDEIPGVARKPSGSTAELTLKLFLGLETPFALRIVDTRKRRNPRAIVVLRTSIVSASDVIDSKPRLTWLLTGYALGVDGILGSGIHTSVLIGEETFVRGLDGEWHPVRPTGVDVDAPNGGSFDYNNVLAPSSLAGESAK
jgi:hypothetical protein